MNNEILTVEEVAIYLRVCTDTIYDMCRRKEIPHVKMKRRYVFQFETIKKWLCEQESSNCTTHINPLL
ncbi:helix-turn-helix domain-containing protein [Metabacillus schmidteae]|uniref:helix-turn-helix domain-containing protein n=1 Tax=Metabacillus schmidteae TaxID=2730405 RepID=UPI00158BDB5E|nr:helix-turn-helix domain-containing protein [Metabacillus schmidteae]